MAQMTIKTHMESNLDENGRRIPFFIMGPCAPEGGTVDEPVYSVYPLWEDWNFGENGPLPTIYDNLTIEDARAALVGLCHDLHDTDDTSA